MEIEYKGHTLTPKVIYTPADGKYCIEIVVTHPEDGLLIYGGVGRDFNSAFMDLLDNLETHFG